MQVSFEKLGNLCSIRTGYPASRLEKKRGDSPGVETAILLPRAMEDGCIIDAELRTQFVDGVKEDFYTRKADLVLKLSTPYDCVYIDALHEQILVTSFAVILRAHAGIEIDMRYIAAFLSAPQTKNLLQHQKIL